MGSDVVDNGSGKKRKVWVILVVVFLVVVLVASLGMAIFLRGDKDGEGAGEQEDTAAAVTIVGLANSANAALYTCEGIENKYTNGEITFNDSREEYKKASGESGNAYKVYLAMCYADFVDRRIKNIDWAVEIMEEVESLARNEKSTVMKSYYAVLQGFYSDIGNDEGVDRVDKILNDKE